MALQAFQLVMRTGPSPEKVFALSQTEVYIGRDISNDIVINDAEISRKHSRLVLQSGQYMIEDLGSTNGTFVNGARLYGPTALRSGDVVQLGENVTLAYEITSYDPDATMAINQSAMKAALAEQTLPPAVSAAPVSPATPAGSFAPPPTAAQPDGPVSVSPTAAAPEGAQTPLVEVPSYSAPASAPARSSAAGYQSPPPAARPGPLAGASKLPGDKRMWTFVGIGCLVVVLCMVIPGAILWYIDSQNMWCDILPFLAGCPVY